MLPRLGDLLTMARRRRFVGRASEQKLFQTALTAPELPFHVLHVFGPGASARRLSWEPSPPWRIGLAFQ